MGKRAKFTVANNRQERNNPADNSRMGPGRRPRMDAVSTLLDELKKSGKTAGNLQGFLHVLIGRTITRIKDKTVVSNGIAWRELAGWLKKHRWDPEAVRELGLDPHDLPPRDRQRF